jgi:predicted RNA-binding protein YlxR (DUF448 family)
MRKRAHIPVRMCIGCRRRRKKEEMVRFIRSPDGVFLMDKKKNLDGRGYYLCPNRMCSTLAEKRNKGLGFLRSMDHLNASAKGWA